MQITRKTAIRTLVGFLAGIMNEYMKGQNLSIGGVSGSGKLAELSLGDPLVKTEVELQKEKNDYKACQATDLLGAYCLTPGNLFYSHVVPNTAKLTINLDGWKGFEVTLQGETVFISREDIFKAFKS